MTYSQKLRDPRWLRKRTAILIRDDFTCQHCRETTKPLHCHHKYYHFNTDPWEYPDEALIILCETCHLEEEELLNELKLVLFKSLRMVFNAEQLGLIIDAVQGDNYKNRFVENPSKLAEALAYVLKNPRAQQGFIKFYENALDMRAVAHRLAEQNG